MPLYQFPRVHESDLKFEFNSQRDPLLKLFEEWNPSESPLEELGFGIVLVWGCGAIEYPGICFITFMWSHFHYLINFAVDFVFTSCLMNLEKLWQFAFFMIAEEVYTNHRSGLVRRDQMRTPKCQWWARFGTSNLSGQLWKRYRYTRESAKQ